MNQEWMNGWIGEKIDKQMQGRKGRINDSGEKKRLFNFN